MQSINHAATRGLSRKLFWFAVAFEALAVAAGLTLAAAALIEAVDAAPIRTPSLYMNAMIGAVPFVLVAITEAAKIPLVCALFNMRHLVWRVVVAAALVAVAVITFESALTGFERAFSARVASVEVLQQELEAIDRRDAVTSSVRQRIVDERNALLSQLDGLNQREQEEIKAHTERCQAVGSNCNSKPYIDEIRQNAERQRVPIQAKIDALDAKVQTLAATGPSVDREPIAAAMAQAAADNQIYRLAARFYSKPVGDVTTAEVTFVAQIWFGSIAGIIAITGIVLAGAATLLARQAQGSSKLSRMLRLTLVRIRKRGRGVVERVVERPVEIEKVREVIREIEKIVEVPKIVEKLRIVYLPAAYTLANIEQSNVESFVEAQLGLQGSEPARIERRASA